MYQDAMPAEIFPSWHPKELGIGKSTLLAILMFILIVIFVVVAADVFKPPAQPIPIQVTQATLTQLPKPPPPPPPPKIVPPPKPLPVVIPKPPPVASKIVVPTKAPPPVRHYVKPIPRPVHTETPPPPVQPPTPPQPAAPPAPRTDGIPIYGQQMHAILQSNQTVPPALASLGLSGTAVVNILVAPDGHVISATVTRSSGNPLIDSTALDHALHAHFPPFNANMPNGNLSMTVPIEIDAEDDSQ